jgi:hypothetical protein
VDRFLKYYGSFESRPIFETVDGMLQWAGLYNLTTRTLQEELADAGLSPLLIQELVTVRTSSNLIQCFLPYFFYTLVECNYNTLIFELSWGIFCLTNRGRLSLVVLLGYYGLVTCSLSDQLYK